MTSTDRTVAKPVLPICAVALLAGAWVASAGPLDPPAGPVAPTMKTLSEVEPRIPIHSLPLTISQPGSYYLAENITAAGGGITISADYVTLDLMGFSLSGAPGDGITATGT